MTITNPSAAVADTAPFIHGTFMISLGDNFKSYVDQMRWAHSDQIYSEGGSSTEAVTPAIVEDILNDLGDERKNVTPLFYAKSKIRDTSLGGNPAINPLPQYNEDDDPPAEFTMARADGSRGMGRVYSSQIDDQQSILYLQAGRPKFNTLAAFYSGAVDPDMAVINDKGILYSTAYKIGAALTVPLSIITTIPTIAIEWLYRWANYKEAPITSYYDFQSEQPLYYLYVNSILLILTVNMGWMESNVEQRDDGNASDQRRNQEELDRDIKIDQAQANYNPPPGSPDYIYRLQMDVSMILRRRMKYIYGAAQVSDKSLPTLISEFLAHQDGKTDSDAYHDPGSFSRPHGVIYNLSEGKPLDAAESAAENVARFTLNTMDGIKIGADLGTYYIMQYVGFRLESDISTSETFSNEIRAPEVDGTVNSKFKAVREKLFSIMGGISGAIPGVGGVLSGALDAVHGALDGALSNTGLDGLAQLATGSSMIEIPKIWENSSFRASHSFKVHLRSPAGDDLSILQNIYVPFAFLLALGSPRGQGPASYTSPFLVKAFSKGTVSIPMGMVTEMTITRGASQHGWTRSMKPTEMTIDFTIEDLTPAMFVTMGSSGWKEKLRNVALGTNNKFISYLEMLSGIDLHAKVGWQSQKKRFTMIKQRLLQQRNAGIIDGMRIGGNPIVRTLFHVAPASWSKPTTALNQERDGTPL